MRVCKHCQEEKSLDMFAKRGMSYRWTCKSCHNAQKRLWTSNNPDKQYAAAHKYIDKIKHTQEYKAAVKAKNLKNRTENPDYFYRKAAERRAHIQRVFLDPELTAFVCEEAHHLRGLRDSISQVKWHVDHIVPLKGKHFCGLHIWSNFQVIPSSLNLRKCNIHDTAYSWSESFISKSNP